MKEIEPSRPLTGRPAIRQSGAEQRSTAGHSRDTPSL